MVSFVQKKKHCGRWQQKLELSSRLKLESNALEFVDCNSQQVHRLQNILLDRPIAIFQLQKAVNDIFKHKKSDIAYRRTEQMVRIPNLENAQ